MALTDPEIIRPLLDGLVKRFDRTFLSPDPLFAIEPYLVNSDDAEVAALIGSVFAYGRAALIEKNVAAILKEMQPSPAKFCDNFIENESKNWMPRFKYRFNDRADLFGLMRGIAVARKKHGTLLNLFLESDKSQSANAIIGLRNFAIRLKEYANQDNRSFNHLLPSSQSSPLKRLNLFLRWMVRDDRIDSGFWKNYVEKERLIIPLDIHVGRIARRLGMLEGVSNNLQSALLLTDYLKQLDKSDPVKYDFALCSYGKLGYCTKKSYLDKCVICKFEKICKKL
ncbi:MAG: TIGR02757 family protein [Nitrospinota bacterium]